LPGAPHGARDGAAMAVVHNQTRLSICEALTQIAFGKAMGVHELEALGAQDLNAMEFAGKCLAEAASKGLVKVFGYLGDSTSYRRISPARFDNPIHWQFTHDEFWHSGLWKDPKTEKRVGQWTKVRIDAASLAAWLSSSPVKRDNAGPAKKLAKRADKKELRRAYKERVAKWPKGKPSPSEKEDLEFLRTLHHGLSREKTRDIRRDYAPASWKRSGPKHSSH
jgi:hypothetical protein